MATVQEYLDAYDRQLRTDAETPSAVAVTRLGPLRLVTFAGGRGFVTYRDLAGAGGAVIARWVEGALAYYGEDPGITRVEWKTRAHDRAQALHDALVRNGFVPGEPESIMIGEAAFLAVDVPLPKEITSGGSRASRTSARSVRCRKRSSGAGSPKRWPMRCSEDWASGMGWNSGWQRPTERSSAPAAWSRCPPRSSPVSGAAPRDWNGVGAGSTGRSRRPVHDQRLCLAKGSSTATRPKTRARSSNEQDW